MKINHIYQGSSLEVLKTLPDESINCCVTSPPYWALRDYGVEGQLGLEPTFQEYINKLCDIFDEVKRVLRKDGTCWVNLGDTYNSGSNYRVDGSSGRGYKYNRTEFGRCQVDPKEQGLEAKCLIQIPSRFAIEMCDRGWTLRNEIIWHKPNCMPTSAKDRFTVDFEKLFLFVKSNQYYFEQQKIPCKPVSIERAKGVYTGNYAKEKKTAIAPKLEKGDRERFAPTDGRNMRAVWSINTHSYSKAHFATYPEKLIFVPIESGCPKAGVVLDPFFGSGTTGVVAKSQNKNYIGIELNPEYIKIAEQRLKNTMTSLF